MGDYKGATWNSQALLAAAPSRREAKFKYLEKLMRTNDFVVLTETHSTIAKASAVTALPGVQIWWSHGTAARAGVAIAVCSAFLKNFTMSPPEFIETLTGRVCSLRLRGSQGRLDITGVYMPTGTAEDLEGTAASIRSLRREAHAAVGRAMACHKAALTIITGDFNYVTEEADRVCLTPVISTGLVDQASAKEWAEIEASNRVYEIKQREFTYDSPSCRSRLDRVYTNQPLTDQLDRHIRCAALEWQPRLSRHRAVAFSRTRRTEGDMDRRPLPQWVTARADWPCRVAAELACLEQEAHSPSALRRLGLVKKAMRTVAANMVREKTLLQDESNSGPEDETRSVDDNLGGCLALLRACEEHRIGAQTRLLARWPALLPLVGHCPADRRWDGTCDRLREEALKLARQAAMEDLHALHNALPHLSDGEAAVHRGRIMRRLSRLSPGRTTSISAVMDATGHVATAPADMADALRRHWAGVFAARRVDEAALRQWLREEDNAPPDDYGRFPLPAAGHRCWEIRRKDVERAVADSGDSSPGPDGLSFAAWRRLGPLGVDILYDALIKLMDPAGPPDLADFDADDNDDPSGFNEALMVFLPKKASHTTADGTEVYAPENTRPLSIVNCDNRLMASAVRYRIEPILDKRISSHQRGFLPGRRMLLNILEVDFEMHAASLEQEKAVAIFFDFAAAFPSIAHRFLIETLRAEGLPPHILQYSELIYSNNTCCLSVGGGTFHGFQVNAGIRQGCPLSPLLFALAVDGLLRRLARALPSATFRAYADDLAMVAKDLDSAIAVVAPIFAKFAAISGLRLNYPKTVVVPLYITDLPQLAGAIGGRFVGWGGASFDTSAKYLGFVLGPGRGTKQWQQAFGKFRERVAGWSTVGLGLHYAAVAWGTYLVSVLGFLVQLDSLPPEWEALEAWALRRLAPGPFAWCLPTDLHRLKSWYGMPKDFSDMAIRQRAAKIRVAWTEARAQGGAPLARWCSELRDLNSNSPYLVRRVRWADWHASCFAVQVHTEVKAAARDGHTFTTIEDSIAKQPRPWTEQVNKRVRRSFQRACTELLDTTPAMHREVRLRHKLARWPVPCFPRIRAIRAAKLLDTLAKIAPPRVVAAILRTWFNGWCADRRFQARGIHNRGCIWGCQADDGDALEHYAACPKLQQFGWDTLRIPWAVDLPTRRAEFFLLTPGLAEDPEQALRLALRTAAAYRTHNLIRTTVGNNPAMAQSILRQSLIEISRADTRCSKMVETAWMNN